MRTHLINKIVMKKQAQIGLRLPVSGPENPHKPVRFWDVKISALISLYLPKYGYNGLEKRGSPRPFKARFVFPGRFACLRRDLPYKGSLSRSFFPGSGKNGYITRYLSSTGVRFNDQRGRISHRIILPFCNRNAVQSHTQYLI
jgi:hypothetical protein